MPDKKFHPDFIPDGEQQDDISKFTTKLTPQEEIKFNDWVVKNKIPGADNPTFNNYDMRGFWKENPTFQHKEGEHFTDKFKQPKHETFSVESKYAAGRVDAGRWEGEGENAKFIPPDKTAAKAVKSPTGLHPDFIPDSNEEGGPDEPSAFRQLATGTSKWLGEHPRVREIGERFLTGTSPEHEQMLKEHGITKTLGTPQSEGSVLPEWKSQPESFAGGFAKSIYSDFIRPQFTPSGFAGWGSPGPGIPGKTGRFGTVDIQDLGNVRPEQKLLTAGPKFQAETPGGVVANTAAGESIPIRRSTEIPYRPTVETPSGRLEQSFSTAAGDTPRAQEAWNKFATEANAAPKEPIGLLPEGVRQPQVNDLLLSEEGKLPGEMSTADALMYEPEFKPWRGLSNLSEAILGRDIMKRDINAGLDPHRGPIDFGPGIEEETSLISSRPKGADVVESGDISLQNPTPSNISKLESEGYVRGETLPDGSVTMRYGKPTQKPTAKYKYTWEDEHGNPMPMYEVIGGESHGSDVTADTLRQRGIDVPETPGQGFIADSDQTAGGIYPIKNKEALDQFARGIQGQVEGEGADRAGQDLENIFKKTSPENYEPPSFARTEEGKLKMGLKEGPVIQILRKFYEGNPSAIAAKELLQNSIDEINTAHPKGTGKIDVNFDTKNKTLIVSDNGRGMTGHQIETIYTDIGDTGKKSSETVGGFGVAKAAIQLAGENVAVETVAKNPKTKKLEKTSYSTTPEDLVGGRTEHQTVEVPDDTPTGTKVSVKFGPDSDFYDARNFVRNLGENSTFKGEITHNADVSKTSMTGLNKPKGKVLGTVNEPYADMTLSIPAGTPNVETQSIQLILSNKGMFQGIMNHSLDFPMKVPAKIAVDVSSKVDALHDDYAFNPSRERLKWKASNAIGKMIQEHIVDKSMAHRKKELQKLYDTMPEISIGGGAFPNIFGRKIAVHDPGNRFTPEEFKAVTSNPAFHNIAGEIAKTIDDVISSLKGKYNWTDRLDKLGITFDNTLHGVHIPNPDTGHSMILINPFLAMSKGATVDEAAGNVVHTILHEVAHMDPYLRGHNESFTVRLGEVYKHFGARREVNALNKFEPIFGTSTGEYHPELQEILQRYTESRGRETTSEDLLTGTGIGSRVGKSGGGDSTKGNRPDGDGTPTEKAVNKLFSAMADAKVAAEEQATNLRIERGRRFAASAGVKAEGMEGAKKSLGKMKGEYEKSELPDALKMKKEDVDSLFTAVKRANITQPEKIRGYTALFKLLNGEEPPVRSELAILNTVFGNGFGDKIVEMHGGIGLVGLRLAKVANTMKALQSSADLSAPLRQGIGLVHRPEWRDAFTEMFKYVARPEYFKEAMQALEERPTYLLGREAGLFLAKPDSLLDGEEAFMNNYLKEVGQIPGGVGTAALLIPKGSERAYTGFLNKLRADVFDNLIKEAKAAGHEAFTIAEHVDEETGQTKRIIVPSKTTENIAKYVNIATGRGNLGRLEKITPELNMFIWSPKLIKSRLDTLNPMYYASLDPFTRRQAIKSLFAIAAFGAITTSLAAITGVKVKGNPFSTAMDWFKPATKKGEFMFGQKSQVLSADFGKMRLPQNQVLDPWAGFQQPIVAAFRFTSGSTDAGLQSRAATVGNFAANKLSPAASLAFDIASAKIWTGGGNYINRFGQPANLPREVAKRFVPIFTQDLADLAKSDNTWAEKVGLGTLSGLGMGVQDYPERSANKARKMRLSF